MKVEDQIIKDWAEWLVDIGYGFSFQYLDDSLPSYMKQPLAEAWHQRDALNDETVEDYYYDLSLELGWE